MTLISKKQVRGLPTDLSNLSTGLTTLDTDLHTNYKTAEQVNLDIANIPKVLQGEGITVTQDSTTGNYTVKANRIELFEIVSVLPATDIVTNKIYMLADKKADNNEFVEWVYMKNPDYTAGGTEPEYKWEVFGHIELDLSGYALKT
jgi:hypothetical protein